MNNNILDMLPESNYLADFDSNNKIFINDFFMSEYSKIKTAYRRIGDPKVVLAYAVNIGEYLKLINGCHISVAVYFAYIAELMLAQGLANDSVEEYLNIGEFHAISSPCSDSVRIKTLANIYLCRSVNQKAQNKKDYAWTILGEMGKSQWIKDNSNGGFLIPLNRQKVMMGQSHQDHVKMLENSVSYKDLFPVEYYATVKRAFEFLTNKGHVKTVEYLMPEVIRAFSKISHATSFLAKISFLKNIGQANALLGNIPLSHHQLTIALKNAEEKGLRGQIRQINNLLFALDGNNVIGALETFKV